MNCDHVNMLMLAFCSNRHYTHIKASVKCFDKDSYIYLDYFTEKLFQNYHSLHSYYEPIHFVLSACVGQKYNKHVLLLRIINHVFPGVQICVQKARTSVISQRPFHSLYTSPHSLQSNNSLMQ